MTKSEISIMLRWPRLPSIVLSPHGLTVALDRGQLVAILNSIPQSDSLWEVKVIDFTGCEFWFHTGQRILAPGLGARTWTKRKLIELYHDRCADGQNPYKPRNLQNYRFGKIIEDIAHLLNMPDSTAHAQRAQRPLIDLAAKASEKRLATKSLQLSP